MKNVDGSVWENSMFGFDLNSNITSWSTISGPTKGSFTATFNSANQLTSIAVARSMGITVAYLPGLAMRRAADLYPGNAKTDARDAFVIAEAARTMPHILRRSCSMSVTPLSSPPLDTWLPTPA